MAHTRYFTVNGNAGAFTPISATQSTRRVEFIEDYSANAGVGQGLQVQYDDGNTPPFTLIRSIAPQSEPFILGAAIAQSTGAGRVVGRPADNSNGLSTPATLLANVRSASASTTIVAVTEYD